MTKHESDRLLSDMRAEDYHGEVKRLGNGEYVVVINFTYLWSRADWRKYKKGKLASMESVQEQVKVL